MRPSIVLSLLFGLGGVAAAERPAHDQTCQCTCTPTPAVPGRSEVAPSSSSSGMRGTDVEVPLSEQPLPPRPLPSDNRAGGPIPFGNPGTVPSSPGLPTPTPWHD
jgi:hypothetical protein